MEVRRSIAKPRTSLAGALRKLKTALVKDPREFGARAREFCARFHDYSPFNRLLIHLQRPDATFVKGRKQWAVKDGRTVRRGSRAIYIIAPVLKANEGGGTFKFSTAKVYDVSDTDGPPFSAPTCSQVQGKDDIVKRRLHDLEEWVRGSGIELLYQTPLPNALVDGMTDGFSIWVRPDLGAGERLAVLAHEIAHVKLHFRRSQRGQSLIVEDPMRHNRYIEELEAELTAFMLLEFAGVDSSKGAAAYLNSWQASAKKIQMVAERCFRAACSILHGCEKKKYRRLVEEDAMV